MKITDKQRIDFVQRHNTTVSPNWAMLPYGAGISYKGSWSTGKDGYGYSWRQAVDKAIKAYMEGRSEH